MAALGLWGPGMPRRDVRSWKRPDEQSGLTVRNEGGGRPKSYPQPLGPAQAWGGEGPPAGGGRARDPPQAEHGRRCPKRPCFGFLVPRYPSPRLLTHGTVCPGICPCQPENWAGPRIGSLRLNQGCPGPRPAGKPSKWPGRLLGTPGRFAPVLAPGPPAHMLCQTLSAPQAATS